MKNLALLLILVTAALSFRKNREPVRSDENKDHPLNPTPHNQGILVQEQQQMFQISDQESSDNACSQNILNLDKENYEYAEIQYQGQLWTDESFKKEKALAGRSQAFTRASSKMKEVRIFSENKVSAGDVSQGSLGNCYFLGAIAALAEHPKMLRSIFLTGDNAAGIYSTLFWIGGKPVVVTVDDNFPSHGEGGNWAYVKVKNDEQIWPMILEKSWAKLAGGYGNTAGGFNRRALHALTGAPVRGQSHHRMSESDLFNLMEDSDKNHFFMGTWTQKQSCGIVNYHAYTPISVFRDIKASDGKSYNLVQVRNPWGSNKWEGDFSEDSHLWTEQQKKQFKVGEEGGTFFMKIADYKKCFYYTSVAEAREGYTHSYMEFKNVETVTKRFMKYKSESFAIMVQVTPKRFVPGKQCTTSAKKIDYKLFKVSKTKEEIASTRGGQSDITVKDGGAGEYELQVSVEWKEQIEYLRTFVVNIYSSESNIRFLDVQEGNAETCTTKVDKKLPSGGLWHLSGQKTDYFKCWWFNRSASRCKSYGTWGRNEGLVANDACVGCGGGECPP